MKNKKTIRAILIILILTGASFLIIRERPTPQLLSSIPELPGKLILSTASAVIIFAIICLLIHIFEKLIGCTTFTFLTLLFIALMIGLIPAALISGPLSCLPGPIGTYAPILLSVLLSVFSILLMREKQDAFSAFMNRLSNGKFQLTEMTVQNKQFVLLDTSVIIDGRISDIAQTGFLPGSLLIPRFVLHELQYIADSEDSHRRQRGRRGLDILSEMQKNETVPIIISDIDVPEIREVDSKLVALARQLNCPVLTNDYNLNKVADLQGVRILNVNDLANAVKSIMLPGEKLIITVIQEGKEQNQGVGYLEDGTMVVIENGRIYLNREIDVVVTKILQTAAGRMIFARHERDLGVKR